MPRSDHFAKVRRDLTFAVVVAAFPFSPLEV
jgi:hypothetical protein